MSASQILEAVVGGLLAVIGVVSAVRTMGKAEPDDAPKLRTLITLHAVAKAGFWLGLAAVFFAYAFRDSLPGDPRVLFPIPLAMSGLRLLTAFALMRNLPEEE